MAIITAEWLQAGLIKPCQDQLDRFTQTWPDGMEVTEENARKALSLKLKLSWVIEWRLSPPIWTLHWEDAAPLWKGYLEDIGPFREQCDKDIAIVWVWTVRRYFESSQAK